MSTSGASPEVGASAEELHYFVCDLARRTGELQLSRYDDPGEIKEKAPKDLVTEVDLLCEEFLIDEIRNATRTTQFSPRRGVVRSQPPAAPGSSIPWTAQLTSPAPTPSSVRASPSLRARK